MSAEREFCERLYAELAGVVFLDAVDLHRLRGQLEAILGFGKAAEFRPLGVSGAEQRGWGDLGARSARPAVCWERPHGSPSGCA